MHDVITETQNPKTCPIWPEFPIKSARYDLKFDAYEIRGSARARGNYGIRSKAVEILSGEYGPYGDRARARLTTKLIAMRRQGQDWPIVTPALLRDAQNAVDMPVHERADRLLILIGEKTQKVGQVVKPLRSPVHPPAELQLEALAKSESVDETEVAYLEDYLHKSGLISGAPGQPVVTVEGHARIAELSNNTDSAQAFVAMWFDPSMNEVYEKAIKPAIEGAGYDAFIIDRHDFTGKIEDEIIAQIRQSRFVVADFTHALGATVRGSVYYEAGFAHGLNIPVIFTAREESDLHFDTAHYNHIMWTPDDLPKLRKGLYDRILAVNELGEGPRARGG